MEYLQIFFSETYKIVFLLIPVLVSVAMIVWLEEFGLLFRKEKDLML